MTHDELLKMFGDGISGFGIDVTSKEGQSRRELAMTFYMFKAFKDVQWWPELKAKTVLREIAMSAVRGIDECQTSGYRVNGIERDMGGFEYLAYYYVIASRFLPQEKVAELGIGEFAQSYKTALAFWKGQK